MPVVVYAGMSLFIGGDAGLNVMPAVIPGESLMVEINSKQAPKTLKTPIPGESPMVCVGETKTLNTWVAPGGLGSW